MLENAAFYTMSTTIGLGYLTCLLHWKVQLLRRSAMLLNYVGLAIFSLTLIFLRMDRSTMGGLILQLVLQNSFFVNVMIRQYPEPPTAKL